MLDSLKIGFSNTSPLSIHEKITILLFACFLSVLIKFAFRAPEERWPQNKSMENPVNHQIVIWIYGELEAEGRYHFFDGTTLRDVLGAISLKKEADISGLNLSRPLKTGQRIKIKKMHKSLVNK